MTKPTETRESKPTPVKQLSIFRTLVSAITAGLLFPGLFISCVAQAAVATETLERIEAAVVRFVERQHSLSDDLRVRVGRLDQRLRLIRCRQDLEPSWAPGSATTGRATVAVRCTGAQPWKLYVPVRVALEQTVVVSARPLSRGERIGPGDLVFEKRNIGQRRGMVVLDPAQVQGYLLKHSISAGKVLLARMLSAPKLVQRGRAVTLTAISPGLNIHMQGIALEDGLMGDTIKVRNPVSKRVLHAIVTAPGQVSTRTP